MTAVPFDPGLHRATRVLVGGAADPSVVPWESLRAQDLRAIRSWATETHSLPDAARILRSVSSKIQRAAVSEGTPQRSSIRMRQSRPEIGLRVPAREVALLLAACDADSSPRGRRDAAVVALLALAGLRASEISRLQLSDFAPEDRSLRIRSKRSGYRVALLNATCARIVDAWLDARARVRGRFFLPVGRDGEPRGGALGRAAVNQILNRLSLTAGVRRLRPSDFRHSFLLELKSRARRQGFSEGRYWQTEDGEAGWIFASLDLDG